MNYFISEIKTVLCAFIFPEFSSATYKLALSTADLNLFPKLQDFLDVPGKGILDFSVRQ